MSGAFREGKMDKNNLGLNYFDPNFLKEKIKNKIMSGLIGKKIGMTSIFDESGKNIPCTVIEAGPCIVTQVRTCLLYTSPSPRD